MRDDNSTRERIKTAFERNARALSLRPSLGRGTAVTRVRLEEGLRCVIEEGRWRLVVDSSRKSGGMDAGPNPGVLGRGALGSCLAMCYAQWAAVIGVPITALEVEVQADYDARAHHGVGDAGPGYEQVRYIVTVESEAPEEDIIRLLDLADEHTPYHSVFRHPVDLRREVRVVAVRSE